MIMEDIIQFLEENQKSEASGGSVAKEYVVELFEVNGPDTIGELWFYETTTTDPETRLAHIGGLGDNLICNLNNGDNYVFRISDGAYYGIATCIYYEQNSNSRKDLVGTLVFNGDIVELYPSTGGTPDYQGPITINNLSGTLLHCI